MTDFEEYQATGMLGGYKPGDVSEWRYMGGNKMFPDFKNTEYSESDMVSPKSTARCISAADSSASAPSLRQGPSTRPPKASFTS